MAAQEGSPNWYWQQLGYQIERAPTAFGNRRAIRRPDGSEVIIAQRQGEQRADAEVRAAQAESPQLPHGATECAKAQLDIFHDSKEPAA